MHISQINNQTHNTYASFKSANNVKKGYRSYRYHNEDTPTTGDKVRAAAGAVIGTALPMIYFAKKQNGKIDSISKLFKIEYKLPEMVALASGSIVGGVLFGMIGESAKKCQKKFNEGVFQFMNAVMPAVMVSGVLEFSKKHKKLNNPTAKVIGTVAALTAGMYMGAKASNLITDPRDEHPDRKLTMKDAAANVDDLIGALVLAKFPMVDNLQAEKILPAVYAWCGYRAGQNS